MFLASRMRGNLTLPNGGTKPAREWLASCRSIVSTVGSMCTPSDKNRENGVSSLRMSPGSWLMSSEFIGRRTSYEQRCGSFWMRFRSYSPPREVLL